MVPAFLIPFAVICITIYFINNAKFLKPGGSKHPFKETEEIETTDFHQPVLRHLDIILLVLKAIYYRYIERIPNYEAAERLMAKVGHDIRLRLPFGSTEYQVTTDPIYAKQIMSDPSWPEGMPVDYYLQDAGFHKPYGLVTGGGKYYKPANRITSKLLQQLGFFNPVQMEGRFLFEMEELERKFDVELALNGGEHTFCPRDIFGYLSINVVLHILLGKRDALDEAVVAKLINSITTNNKKLVPVTTLLEIIPFLRHFPKLTFMKHFNKMSDVIYDVFREVIEEKRWSGKYKERVEDFVDGLLEHVDKNENHEDGLNERNMLVVLRDMLMAGGDTTSATLEHALLFMSLHPKVQERVQAEIDGVIGPDRAPSYEDRRRMPFTEATLHEVYRIGSSVPATARAKHKGDECSYALINIYGVHRNAVFYNGPNEFKPERFLDKEDPTKVVNTANLMPFGYGRRSCPGETAARVAVFVYFVVMLQKYSIKLSSRHPAPSMKNTHGFSRSPLGYFITIRRRL